MIRAVIILLLLTIGVVAQPFTSQDPAFLLSTSPLRPGLVGYWQLNETTGKRYDRSKNGNHLTSNNSVGAAPGVQGQCSTFLNTSNQSLSIGHNSSLNVSGILELHCWVRLRTKTNTMVMTSKWDASGHRSFQLQYNQPADRFTWLVATNTSTSVSISANTFGSPSTNVWYHLGMYADGTNMAINVNNGTFDTTACLAVSNSDASFDIGALGNTPSFFFNGDIDEFGIWNRLLTSNQRLALYKGGVGSTWPMFAPVSIP